ANYKLKTDRDTMQCQILLKDGKLLPFAFEGEPIPKARPFQFVGTRSEDMTFLASLHVEALGVKIDADNLRFEIRIERGLTSGNIEAKFAGMDRLEVNGKVLGFIPMSIVNAVVPIEESTRDSMDVAIRGFAGLGTRIGMGFDNPGDARALEGQREQYHDREQIPAVRITCDGLRYFNGREGTGGNRQDLS